MPFWRGSQVSSLRVVAATGWGQAFSATKLNVNVRALEGTLVIQGCVCISHSRQSFRTLFADTLTFVPNADSAFSIVDGVLSIAGLCSLDSALITDAACVLPVDSLLTSGKVRILALALQRIASSELLSLMNRLNHSTMLT